MEFNLVREWISFDLVKKTVIRLIISNIYLIIMIDLFFWLDSMAYFWMILSALTVSCCKLCCKIEKISQKTAMSFKNCLFQWHNLWIQSFVYALNDSNLQLSDYLIRLFLVLYLYLLSLHILLSFESLVMFWICACDLHLPSRALGSAFGRPRSCFFFYYGIFVSSIYMFFCHHSFILWII